MVHCLGPRLQLHHVYQKGMANPNSRNTTLSPKTLPNAMHDHQRIARGLIAELLQQFVEDVIVALYARIGFGNEILEQPRPLYKKKKISRH